MTFFLRSTEKADVTVRELYKGALNREQLTTIGWFLERNHVTRLPVSAAASQRAVTLLHAYGLPHGLGIPDALIAATSLEGDHTLVTSNLRHLRFIAGYAWSRRRTGFPNRILPHRAFALERTARLCALLHRGGLQHDDSRFEKAVPRQHFCAPQ